MRRLRCQTLRGSSNDTHRLERGFPCDVASRGVCASPFENARAFVQLEQEWFAIDRNGEPTPRDPRDLIPEQRMGKWGFVTPEGKVAVDFRFDGVQPFSKGLAAVQVGERWGFVDRGGRLVIPAQFEDGWATPPGGARGGPPIDSFREGLAAVYKDGSWRFIDAKGTAIPGQFVKAAEGNFGSATALPRYVERRPAVTSTGPQVAEDHRSSDDCRVLRHQRRAISDAFCGSSTRFATPRWDRCGDRVGQDPATRGGRRAA